jgi:hypothetical protein
MCNVPHNKSGNPNWWHTRTDKHQIGEWRNRRLRAGEAQCQPRDSMTQEAWITRARCMLHMAATRTHGRRRP